MIPDRIHSKIDKSGITILHSDMVDTQPAPVHLHDFYELVLVARGSCELRIPGLYMPLIAGDLILLYPGQPHLFRPEKSTFILYCQFDPTLATQTCSILADALRSSNRTADRVPAKRMRELRAFEQESGEHPLLSAVAPTAVPCELLHLSHTDADHIQQLYQSMLIEQTEQKQDHIIMKQLLLDQLLITAARIAAQQYVPTQARTSWQEEFINNVLAEIERSHAQDIDFGALAAQGGITLSHFRTIFKKHTGLSPVDYLNRARIMRALELLQTTDLPVSEVSIQVGIYDPNYFTRLFKKVTGYPPRYFKSISR